MNIKSLLIVFFMFSVTELIAYGISFNGQEVGGIPVLVLVVAVIFLIQWVVFVPSSLNKTEKFFDLTGGLTYITSVIVVWALVPEIDLRSLILGSMIIIWAARLSIFLFRRVIASGEDRRFEEIKASPSRFLVTWSIQGLWISLTAIAAFTAMTTKTQKELDFVSWLGILIWIFGFTIEVIADWQKSKFRSIPENKGKFIASGLWSWSRHPNYFGEIVLWVGIAIIALPVLSGFEYISLISPIFVYLLLTKLSGVPLLEKSADKRWGEEDEYKAYIARTSVLLLRPPRDNMK